MSFLSHPWFNNSINLRRGVQIIRFLFMESPPAPCYLFCLKSKYLPRYSCSHLVFIFVVCWTGLTPVRIHLKYCGEFMTFDIVLWWASNPDTGTGLEILFSCLTCFPFHSLQTATCSWDRFLNPLSGRIIWTIVYQQMIWLLPCSRY